MGSLTVGWLASQMAPDSVQRWGAQMVLETEISYQVSRFLATVFEFLLDLWLVAKEVASLVGRSWSVPSWWNRLYSVRDPRLL